MKETRPQTPKPRGTTTRNGKTGKPKRSRKQREVARETALRLVAEGRFGGKVGAKAVNPASRTTPKHVPRAAFLLQILRTVERYRLKGEQGPLSRLVDYVPDDAPELARLDRARASELVCDALQASLDAKTVPRRSVVSLRRKNADLLWKSRQRPLSYGERLIDLHDPRDDDFVGYGPHELLQCCALLGDRMVHHGPRARAAGDYVLTVLQGPCTRTRAPVPVQTYITSSPTRFLSRVPSTGADLLTTPKPQRPCGRPRGACAGGNVA